MSWSETKLLMDAHDEILSKMGQGVIKSIQRGSISLPRNTDKTVSINSVNTGKSVILYARTSVANSGSTMVNIVMSLTNSTTLNARFDTGYVINGDYTFTFTIVEFY